MDWFMGKGRRKDKEAETPTHEEERLYVDDQYSREKVIDSDLARLVALPTGVDYQEWLASHTLSFFEHVNLLYGAVSEFCTNVTCSSMTGPGNTQYYWIDERGKKCKVSAPQYVDYVMSSIQKTIQDESVFPTKYGNPFPANLALLCKRMHLWLFHVLTHIYAAHYKEVLLHRLHPHLNTFCEHFLTFNERFSLVDDKETDVLADLFVKLQQGPVLTVLGADEEMMPVAPMATTSGGEAGVQHGANNHNNRVQSGDDDSMMVPPPPLLAAACVATGTTASETLPFVPAESTVMDNSTPPAILSALMKHEPNAATQSAAVAMVTDQSEANKENLATAHEPKRSL